MAKAIHLLHEDVREFHQQLGRLLAENPPEAIALVRLVTAFVDGAGAEAAKKRDRLRQASTLAADFYRHQIRGLATNRNPEGYSGDLGIISEASLYRLQRSMDVRYQVDRNANQATLIESWAYDLQRGSELGSV